MTAATGDTPLVAVSDLAASYGHIAALKPRFVSRDEVPEEYVANERSIYVAQAVDIPEHAREKAVEGKLSKHLASICLLDQEFVRDQGEKKPRTIEALRAQCHIVRHELDKLVTIQNQLPSLEDRLVTTGYLSPEFAASLGCQGYVGRASGVDYDLRRDAPYAPYDRLKVKVPCYHYGDVAARLRVRVEEIRESLTIIEALLNGLPAGAIRTAWRPPTEGAEGLGLVEGFRGEILAYVRFGANNAIARYFPRDPSWLTWPTLEKLVRDNIVPDFPVCNKSVNGSYSGHDL